MVEIRQITFGQAFLYEGKIPNLQIWYKDDNDEHRNMYLECFRDYKFQVSGTIDGEWDYGSTPVFGLETFSTIVQKGKSNLDQELTVKMFISFCIEHVLNKACRYISNENIRYIPPTDLVYDSLLTDINLLRFIDATYEKYALGNLDSSKYTWYTWNSSKEKAFVNK